MQFLFSIVKGFVIGVAKIIPGVSGAMLAMTMGVYEKAVRAISHFFDNPKSNFKFLFPLGLGAILAIVIASKVAIYFLNHFYLATMLLFIGLIIGGIPSIFKQANIKNFSSKNIFYFIISFLFVLLLSLIGKQQLFLTVDNSLLAFLTFLGIGLLDAATMVIPGISGTAIMMILGCYHLLINLLASLTNPFYILSHLSIIFAYLLGVIIGVILIAKWMDYAFQNKREQTYSMIFGFALGSILLLLLQTMKPAFSILEIITALFLLTIGYQISYHLENEK